MKTMRVGVIPTRHRRPAKTKCLIEIQYHVANEVLVVDENNAEERVVQDNGTNATRSRGCSKRGTAKMRSVRQKRRLWLRVITESAAAPGSCSTGKGMED